MWYTVKGLSKDPMKNRLQHASEQFVQLLEDKLLLHALLIVLMSTLNHLSKSTSLLITGWNSENRCARKKASERHML